MLGLGFEPIEVRSEDDLARHLNSLDATAQRNALANGVLTWAALTNVPTFDSCRRSIFEIEIGRQVRARQEVEPTLDAAVATRGIETLMFVVAHGREPTRSDLSFDMFFTSDIPENVEIVANSLWETRDGRS